MEKALDIARYLINYSKAKDNPISNLKLQKLLYFLWRDYYKQTNSFLFEDSFQAWQLGPVIPEVYYEFCAYGGNSISALTTDININRQKIITINTIIDQYLAKSAYDLVEETHREGSPWEQVYSQDGYGQVIPPELIIDLELKEGAFC